MRLLCLSICLALAASITPVRAEAIDCSDPVGPFDRMVCASPELRAANDDMRAAFDAVHKQLSDEGRKILTDGQRQWLTLLREVLCTVDPSVAARRQHRPRPPACAEEELRRRAHELPAWNGAHGPFVFVTRQRYRHWPALPEDANGYMPGFFYEIVSWIAIDGSTSADAQAFNRLIERERTRCPDIAEEGNICGPGRDSQVFEQLLRADQDIVQVARGYWTLSHGAPRGYGSSRIRHFILPLERELVADDLFVRTTPWQAELAKQSLAFLQTHSPWIASHLDTQTLIERYYVAEPESWRLEPGGLVIVPVTRWIDAVRDGIPEVTIPWSALQAFLRDPLPFRLPR